MLAKQRAGGKRIFPVEIDSLFELTTLIRSPSLMQCSRSNVAGFESDTTNVMV